MKDKETKISFTRDIIKEVASELNIDIGKVQSVYDTQIMYLRHLINNTDAVAIFIPFIGTLHIKLWFIFRQIRRFSKKEEDKPKLDLYLRKKERVGELIETHIEEKYNGRARHLERNSITRYAYNCGKSMEEIEEIQNNR